MAPSFTLKALSPARPSLPLSIPSNHPTPLSSPGRSPINASSGYFPSSPLHRRGTDQPEVSRDDAFKIVRHLEDVLSAWNEYRLTLTATGKAGKKLAGAMKDLAGCMDKTEVPAQTIKPSAAMIESTSDLLSKLSKRVDAAYDQANADASKYFTLLAKESRSHDAYLGAVSKKHDKAEKAYRKASKAIGDTAGAHSGLVALKTSLSEDMARANADQSMLLGSKQAGVLTRTASVIGGLAGSITSYFSEGLRKAGAAYPDIEYFRALADVQWQGALPSDLEEETELKQRDGIRLIKTRIALGERDVVGEQAWHALSTGPPTPQSAPRAVAAPGPVAEKPAPEQSPKVQDAPATESVLLPAPRQSVEKKEDFLAALNTHEHIAKEAPTPLLPQRDRSVMDKPRLPEEPLASPPSSQERHKTTSSSATMTSSENSRILASSPRESDLSSRRHPLPHAPISHSNSSPDVPTYGALRSLHSPPLGTMSRPPAGPRNISMPGHAPRRSVSQIARDMERHAVSDRQNTFEAHQGHRAFVSGCSLCSMDYDRMVQMRQQASRRVTMPPTYTQPLPDEVPQYHRNPEESSWSGREVRRSSYYGSNGEYPLRQPSELRGLQAPTPRRATGGSPDFGFDARSR